MECRPGCGACCVAPSIASPLPGMPDGKPAGVRCVHLGEDARCAIYDRRPAVCEGFAPSPDACGASREEALALLSAMEVATKPDGGGTT